MSLLCAESWGEMIYEHFRLNAIALNRSGSEAPHNEVLLKKNSHHPAIPNEVTVLKVSSNILMHFITAHEHQGVRHI